MSEGQRLNIIVIVSDTLRTAEIGCYGSRKVHTPNLDAFAAGATRFTRAYPESLPTIPVRRALHTGRRAYPFANYRAVPWDIVYLPGWQPMDDREDTLAEQLAPAGYQTGFVTDTLPYFAPGFNFTRGFFQWEFVRGQQQDRWRSPFSVPQERLARYGDVAALRRERHGLVAMHLANTAHVRGPEDTSTARTFQWAMDFLADNRGQPFYLMVDCFDPHEPWEAPEEYYRLYGPKNYTGRRIVHCGYAPVEQLGYSPEEVAYVHAQYCGLVTLVDAWFGKLMDKLAALGLAENTAVLFISDHGTNFCDNPRHVIGKPDYSLYPGLMHLPLLARLPGGRAGAVRDELVSNLDVPATVYDLAGVPCPSHLDGQSLRPLLGGEGSRVAGILPASAAAVSAADGAKAAGGREGKMPSPRAGETSATRSEQAAGWRRREYVTCRYADSLCCIDDRDWVITNLDREPREVFDLTADPACQANIVEKDRGVRLRRAWKRLLADAGGELPDYRRAARTDAIGEKTIREKKAGRGSGKTG